MQNQIPISEGSKKILNTVKDELFPIIEKLKNILLRVMTHRGSLFNPKSRKLYELKSEYSKVSADFFTIETKLQTPDLLFKELPKNDQYIADYVKFRDAFQRNLDQGRGYVEIIDRTLDRKTQSIQNTATLLISVLAIAISILLR